MSCTLRQIIPRLGPLTGFTPDQIAMAIETARQRPATDDPHPDPAVVDAVLRQAAGHDRQAVTTALRQLLAGLLHLRRRTGARVRSFDPLILAIAERPPADIAASVPMVVARLRSRVFGMAVPDDPPPAPLPVELPEDPNTRQRVVQAAARFAPWTDAEARRIEQYPNLVGLAWTLGVDHPRIRAIVAESSEAAVAAIVAGATDPDLVARVLDNPAVSPFHAAEVLAARPDLTTPMLITAAAGDSWSAAQVLAARPDLTTPQLIAKAAEDPWSAAEVLAARQDITDPALIARAAEKPETAAAVLAARQNITDPALIARATELPWSAAKVLAARPDLTTPQLIAKAAEWSETAATVLAARQDLTDQLIARAAEWATAAAKVLVTRSDLADLDLIRAASREANFAAIVLAARPDLSDPALIARATELPWSAAKVLAARPDLTTPQLIAKAAEQADAAAQVLAARPDLRVEPSLLAAVVCDRAATHTVIDACGPYPALWQRLSTYRQREVAQRYRCTAQERAWLRRLAQRTPLVWTDADDAVAARFPWHHALRSACQSATPSL